MPSLQEVGHAPTFISALVWEGHSAQPLPPVVLVLPLLHSPLGSPGVLALTTALAMLHLPLVSVTCACVQLIWEDVGYSC